MKKLIFSLIIVLALCASSTSAEIYVGDPSFELQSMSGGIYNYIESPWFSNGSSWASYEGEYGVSNVPDGTQYATPSDDDLYQDLAATYEDGKTYILTALASARIDGAAGEDYAWEIALHDTSGNVLASTSGDPCDPCTNLVGGEWDEISVQYTATAADDGKDIRIYFSTGQGLDSANWKFVLDDVHLAKLCDVVGTVVLLDDPMEVNEDDVNGSAVGFSAVLDNAPGATDTITVVIDPNSNGNGLDITLDKGAGPVAGKISLTFTTANWDTPQTVTVKAIDDTFADGRIEIDEIGFTATSAENDPSYDDGCLNPVEVTILDNDSPHVAVSKTSASVAEGGAGDTYTVKLFAAPTSDVTIYVAADYSETSPTDSNMIIDLFDCQVTVNGSGSDTLVFNSGNWDTPQTVTVSAVDDTLYEADPHAITIGNFVDTDDADYSALSADNVDVSITENDTRAWA